MEDTSIYSGWKNWDCPLCENVGGEPVHLVPSSWDIGPPEYSILRCPECNLYRCSPLPPRGEIINYYGKFENIGLATAYEDWIVAAARRSLDILERMAPCRGSMLDIGSGNGLYMHEAVQRGWTVTGIDHSAREVRKIREKYGYDIIHGDFLRMDMTENRFDAVIVSQVIEHLDDPVPMMEKTRKVLKNHGIVYLSTPNAMSFLSFIRKEKFNYWIPPVHLTCFGSASLKYLLKKIHLAEKWMASSGTDFDMYLLLKNRTFFSDRTCKFFGHNMSRLLYSLFPLHGSILEVVAQKID